MKEKLRILSYITLYIVLQIERIIEIHRDLQIREGNIEVKKSFERESSSCFLNKMVYSFLIKFILCCYYSFERIFL